MTKDVSFNRKFECDYGVMVEVTPMIRRIVAQNPGPYTFKGTGTYVVGRGKVAAPGSLADRPRLLRASAPKNSND